MSGSKPGHENAPVTVSVSSERLVLVLLEKGDMLLGSISGKQLARTWRVPVKDAKYREDGRWFHQLRAFPGALFDAYGYILFETEEQYWTLLSGQIKQDINVKGAGIRSLPGYIQVVHNGAPVHPTYDEQVHPRSVPNRTFFTVDRAGSLRPGMVLNLMKFRDISPPQLQEHVDRLFPDGVTAHGERYLLRPESRPSFAEPSVELLIEYVRRAHFPNRPSRFQSVFAVGSLEAARKFRDEYGGKSNTIWQVEAEHSFEADMRLLGHGSSILVSSFLAEQYWKGLCGPEPFCEVLLVPPVRVVCACD